MKQIKLLLALLFITFLTSCSSNTDPLKGSWEAEFDNGTKNTIVFQDGYFYSHGIDGDKYQILSVKTENGEIIYKVKDLGEKRFKLISENELQPLNYLGSEPRYKKIN